MADKRESHPCRVYKVGEESGKLVMNELIVVFYWMREWHFCACSEVSTRTPHDPLFFGRGTISRLPKVSQIREDTGMLEEFPIAESYTLH